MPNDTRPEGVPAPLIDALKQVVGPKGYIDDASAMDGYMKDWRGLFHGRTPLVVRPASTEEAAETVRLCAEARVPMVPQAANTGLVGGSVPDESGSQILISVSRMNRVLDVDPVNMTMTVQAGCVLAAVQQAAGDAGCLFPLSLAAEGSCQIGGNLSSNAGGNNTVRYGNTRDLVLGLEVVLPDGRVWNGLRSLRKDNAGYDLKHLFIGAEGTLGLITAAVLKLYPRPRAREVGMAGIADAAASLELLTRLRATAGDYITSFEFLPRIGVEFVMRHVPGTGDPFAEPHPAYALIELTSSDPDAPLRDKLESVLADAYEAGLVRDAVLAESDAQADALWKLREEMSDSQKPEGASIKNDITVPVSRMAEFIEACTKQVEAAVDGIRVVAFGHVGDGNVHFNLSQPVGGDPKAFLARWDEVAGIVNDSVAAMGGSFAAEHGVGRLRRKYLEQYRGGVELDLMRAVKRAVDPHNLMNPGKVV
ncbi:MAG: FAD-binding oxidoreductase [Acetobacterales bacterium]